jgi:UDP-N-acetylglucosamine--N-acetylmuramyl-(pentapeptide) pyrophosphoryl-undecaprenol N-acetylglucosamine transferase
MVRALIAAGGTGGHIIPALAVGRQLAAMGAQVLYVGHSGGMEEGIYRNAGVEFRTITAQKIERKLTLSHLRLPGQVMQSVLASARIIREFRPTFFYGSGGFVTGPVGFAASLRGVPVYLQEQNSFPGITNRLLGHVARKVFLGYPGAASYFPADRTLLTGNPVILKDEQTTPFDPSEFGLRDGTLRLLVLGGSQGSQAINRALLPILGKLKEYGIDLLWQTGAANLQSINQFCKGQCGIHAFGFSNDLQRFYRAANFALARAGALTLAELEMACLPAVLVPLPSAAGNHQYHNACEAVQRGTAALLEQKQMTPDTLLSEILSMKRLYPEMKTRFGESLHRTAAQNIATVLMNPNRG